MDNLVVRNFLQGSPVDYQQAWRAMKTFTAERNAETPDELWLLEHNSVYTLGQAGDPSHILNSSSIPVIKGDRGGQVTYHGPGQLMCYTLVDLARRNMGVREFVVLLEDVVIQLLSALGIEGWGDRNAPGVYVDNKKIAALGLRVSKGRAYHGLCLNVKFDAGPFSGINPCGYEGMQVTQLAEQLPQDLADSSDSLLTQVAAEMVELFAGRLGYAQVSTCKAKSF